MSDEHFNINNPLSNHILIYDEIQKKFINTEPTLNLFNVDTIVENGFSMGSGERIFNDIQGRTIRIKSITGSNGIDIINNGATVDIHFNGDAQTLDSLTKDDLVQISKNLSDLDSEKARSNLNVYSVEESHSAFLEANASNLPDDDNTYDLGSNGRRFANIFAVTFHGTATESITTQTISQGSAEDGNILQWSDSENDWIATVPENNFLNNLHDVDSSNIQNESVLYYNASRSLWEVVPVSVLNLSGGSGDGDVINGENLGNGYELFSGKIGGILQYRTLLEGNGITIKQSSNSEELIIDADISNTTDDLPEGNNNLYYTDSRVESYLQNVTIQDLGLVDGNPQENQAPIWDGSQWTFGNIVVDINTTDDIPEGNNNLYYNQQRTFNDITTYIDSPSYGIQLSQISDTNISQSSNGLFLKFDNGFWINTHINISDLNDVDLNSLTNNQYLVYDSSNSIWIPEDKIQYIDDLMESQNAKYLNQSNFDSFFANMTTDDLTETNNNKFLNTQNLSTELGNISVNNLKDIDLSSINDGNIIIWDGSLSKFVPASSDDLNITVSQSVSELTDVDSNSINNIQNGYILKYNASQNYFEALSDSDTILKQNDVNASNIQQGQGIVFNGNNFVNEDIIPFNSSSSYSDNDILAYDAANGYFRRISINNIDRSTLNDLDDINITSISDNHILVYNQTDSSFENISKDNFLSVADLKDTTFSSLSQNQVLIYNGSEFVNKNAIIFETANNNDIIIYDSNTNEYVSRNIYDSLNINYQTPSHGATFVYDNSTSEFIIQNNSISNMSDVDISSITTNQVIQWDGSQFIPADINVGSISLNDLTDVDINTVSSNQILQYDGTNFVPINLSDELTTIDVFSDVDLSNIQSGDALTWDGSKFVRNPDVGTINQLNEISNVDDSGIVSGQILEYDGSNYIASNKPPVINQLNDISDVNITSPDGGEALIWSGSSFINATLDIRNNITDLNGINVKETVNGSETIKLDNTDLISWDANNSEFVPYKLSNESISIFNDVVFNNISAGDILQFDGSAFVTTNFENIDAVKNITDLPEIDPNLSPMDGQILIYDANSGYFVTTTTGTGSATQLSELNDVSDTLSPSDGQALIYDSSSGSFSAQTITSDGIGATQLSELGDVDGSLSPNDNDILSFNSSQGYFISKQPNVLGESISEFNDILLDSISTGQYLQWDGSQFVPSTITEGATELNGLSDVDLSTTAPTSGQILEYNGSEFVPVDNVTLISMFDLTNVDASNINSNQYLQWNGSQFVPSTITEGATELNGLSDVDLSTTAPTSGQILEYNGSEFVPVDNVTSTTISDLTDTDISSLTTDDVLVYNGTDFTNRSIDFQKLDWFNISSPSDGDYLVYNSTSGFFEQKTVQIVNSLNDLSDVSVTSPSNGQFIRYNGTNFVNETVNLVTNINDLANVNYSSITSGQILEYNGSEFVPVDNIEGAEKINDLDDVDISSIGLDQILQWDGSQFIPIDLIQGVNEIGNLNDVDISSIGLDQILQWDGSQFIPIDYIEGRTQLSNLDDVNISNISTNQYLQWDGSQFVPSSINEGAQQLNELSDVDISFLENGQILEYDGTNFVNKTYDLSILSTINTSGATDGQVLVYNSSNNVFEPQDQTSSNISTLNDLTDVSVSSPSSGQFIRYNGTNFVNETVNLVTNINDLADVDTTGLSDGQILAYNSSTGNFEVIDNTSTSPSLASSDLTDISTTAPTNGQILVYNDTNGEYEPQDIPSGGSSSGDAVFESFRVVYDSSNNIADIINPSGNLHIEIADADGTVAHIGTLVYPYPPSGINFYAFTGALAEYDSGTGEFTGGVYKQRPLDQALGTGYIYNRDEATSYTKTEPFGNYNMPSTNDSSVPRFYQEYTLNMTDMGASHVDAFTGDTLKFADTWVLMTFKGA
ncbi:hypothetical protein PBI_SCTP2_17 [Salicola phage SCTP-2]|nr:hypothetical protein PBI_SCTP2_17 [Salicola phage SCTP-2]